MDLKDAVVAITGAARGLGACMAERFAAAGARVLLADVSADELAGTVDRLSAAGHTVAGQVADTTDPRQVEAVVSAARRWGPIDVLVNNAGTFSVVAPVWQADPERWFRDVRVNLYGSFLCCRAVAGAMVERGAGYILNIVSSGGVGDPHPYSTSYAASKAGLMRLTEGLAAEVRDHGVKVFAIAPPAVRTAMTQFLLDDPGSKRYRPEFANYMDAGHDHPPECVADAALTLVSGRADALTGRYIEPHKSLDALIDRSADVLAGDLYTLRIRREPT